MEGGRAIALFVVNELAFQKKKGGRGNADLAIVL